RDRRGRSTRPRARVGVSAGGAWLKTVPAGAAAESANLASRGPEVGSTPPTARAFRAPAVSDPGSPAQVTIDTRTLYPGPYLLTLTQLNGVSQAVPVAAHPALATPAGLPLRLNMGQTRQTIPRPGATLQRMQRIDSGDATAT